MITFVPAKVSAFDGNRLRVAREAKKWTQGRLAVKIGKAVSSVYGWEANTRTPEPGTIRLLADTLGITPGELLNVPQEQWSLYEYRIVSGLTQAEVGKVLGVTMARVGNYENAYVEMDPATVASLADQYSIGEDVIRTAWQRSRDKLIADDDV